MSTIFKEWVDISNALILTEGGTNKQYNMLKLCFHAGAQATLRLMKEAVETSESREEFIDKIKTIEFDVSQYAMMCHRVDDVPLSAIAAVIKR